MSKKKQVSNNFKNVVHKIGLLVFFVLAIFTFLFTFNIYKLNVLPVKYVSIIFGVEIIYLLIFGIILIKKKIKWKLKITFSIISILIMVVLSFGNKYMDSTINFFKKITQNNLQTENYYVVVLKNSKYETTEDLKNKKIEYLNGIGSIDEAKKKLGEKLDYKEITTTMLSDLSEDLLNKKTDAIYLADYNKAMLDEDNEEFKNNTKIIDTISLTKEKKVESKEVNITDEPFNIFISGIDTYGEISSVARSDVNILATVNPKTKQVLLTSIPRDYYVNLAGFNQKDKLTHAGMYGIDTSIGTIEELLDTKINYYVRVNFSTLTKLVDTLGGINVYSDYNFIACGEYQIKYGINYLNGEQALAFSRERHSFIDGDRQRGKNQQAVIKAIVDKVTSPVILNKYSDILKTLEGTFQTNMEVKDIQKLIKFQIDKMPSWSIISQSVSGSDSSDYTYTYGKEKLYVMEPDEETVESAKEAIKTVIKGETPEIKD